MTAQFIIEKLAPSHDRNSFSSGVPPLDNYLRQRAGQDARKRVANCFVAVEASTGQLAGFYTLSAAGIPMGALPEEMVRRLPHYPVVPAALIGRLAVDQRFRGRQLGEALLLDAANCALAAAPAVFALLVDAKDETASSFYKRFEFRPLGSRSMTFFLPLELIAATRRKDERI